MFQRKFTTELLKKIRKLMQEKLVDAYLIPMGDAHNNEYLCACDQKIAYISGFTGSAGLAVITKNKAALWTDGRYFEQAENQMDENWTLMKMGQPNTITQTDWLNSEIDPDGKVGCYKYQVTMDLYQQVKNALIPNRSVEIFDDCFVTDVWSDRPDRPSNPIITLSESFVGTSWHSKIDLVRQKLKEEKASALFLSALDEIAWLFNLRGSDIAHNPVFFSFCFLTDKVIHLFLDRCKIENSPELCRYLLDENNCMESRYKVQLHQYPDIRKNLIKLTEHCKKVWLDPRTVCGLVFAISEPQRFLLRSPISLMKSVKSASEIRGMRNCSIEDSVALCQFFTWLEKEISLGRRVTEADAADELDRLRSLLPGFFSPSFQTISCSGRNGGLIHYRAVHGQDSLISNREMYLCDSGGQYLTGTTDVTRTVHFGQPSDEEKRSNTLVLRGHVALASLVFPEGSLGSKLDPIARMYLWKHGMDYSHGTGHGVGAFLNVHEGPCGIFGSRIISNEVGLVENMVLTIEPGFYKPHEYGIRIENDYFLTAAEFDDKSVKYLRFEPLTYFPIQTKLIDLGEMAVSDIEWLNDYHRKCRDKLGDLLRLRGLIEESRWLMRETDPISLS